MADPKRSTKLLMDETRAPVLAPGARQTKTGYFWALARDGVPRRHRAWSSPVGGQHAEWIVQGFGGTLQVDGCAGYNRPDRSGPDRSGHPAGALLGVHTPQVDEITRTGPAPIAGEGVAIIRAAIVLFWL